MTEAMTEAMTKAMNDEMETMKTTSEALPTTFRLLTAGCGGDAQATEEKRRPASEEEVACRA